MLRYHTKVPPDYDLSKITASTYVLHSMNDTLVTPEVILYDLKIKLVLKD